MENINSLESKPKSALGWVFGGLSFIPAIGVFFGVITIIIGAKRKIRGQIFLGIAGILFTIIMYGSLYYFAVVAKTGPYVDLKIKIASQIVNTDAGKILLYKNQHGKLPTKLSDLGTPSETNFFSTTDPWMTEISYTAKNDGTFELRSAGPDKVLDTADDIAQTF